MSVFPRYSGAGNTFVIVDERKSDRFSLKSLSSSKIFSLCSEYFSDGLIIIGKTQNCLDADFSMRIFNCDGSEAEMCGNALRCSVKFLEDSGFSQDIFRIQTKAGIFSAWREGEDIAVLMLTPHSIKWNLTLAIDNQKILLHSLNSGVPHAVHFVKNLHKIDIENLGKQIRHHPHFAPKGTNVDFVLIGDDLHTIHLKTYERGLERESCACATGALAAAYASSALHGRISPISIYLNSKDKLTATFSSKDLSEWILKGPAKRTSAFPLMKRNL